MALIYNPSKNKVRVKALGNFFEFKPEEVKSMNDDIAHFICLDKKESGLVSLPEEYIDQKDTPEMKAIKEEKRIEGLKNQLAYHRWKVGNLMNSLAQDLAAKGMNIDPLTFASDGERESMKIVKELTDELTVLHEDKLAETKDLYAQIKELK